MNTDKINARLEKLLRLVKQGVGGEAKNAERQLQNLLTKHNMTLADIETETRELVWFRYNNPAEKKILTQIFYKVLTGEYSVWVNKGKQRQKGVDVTKQEILEIELMFTIYRKALKEQMEIFLEAFVQKNKIFPEITFDDNDSEPMSDEKLFALRQMMGGIEHTPVNKALEQK